MINIPGEISILLSGSQYEGPIKMYISSVKAILDDNKLPFFPEYTDHGAKHIEELFQTIVKLVPKELWQSTMSDADAAVLICGTLLHDLSMHLWEPGFSSLILPDSPYIPSDWFDKSHGDIPADKPWHLLWNDFLEEGRRWSDQVMHKVFGPPASDISNDWTIRPLPDDWRLWTQYDKRFIGEFLRRHHGRLGHEIALYGFPGSLLDVMRANFPSLLVWCNYRILPI